MITIFLGAGFSAVAGLPLARQLFDWEPNVDKVTRTALVQEVVSKWKSWEVTHHGYPEEYLAYLQDKDRNQGIRAAWYIALAIALRMGQLELVGLKPTITRHNLDRTTGVEVHEHFWTLIFRSCGSDVAVVTTNYDILAERGLRHCPRPRVPRPGFHYGFGQEELSGGGYPSYAHIQKIRISGKVPILKLHGSISWAYRNAQIIKYHDCRPAIRGDAAIVAPIQNKSIPTYLAPIWNLAAEALGKSHKWIFIGYSLPEYDKLILALLRNNSGHNPHVFVLDPQAAVAKKYSDLLGLRVSHHPGLPEALSTLHSIL